MRDRDSDWIAFFGTEVDVIVVTFTFYKRGEVDGEAVR